MSGVAIVYGAYVTLAQTDIKRLIAYSSISHMGFVTLGIFSLDRSGIEGAILQMINHGIITGALFLCVGMIYERTHTREIAEYGGLFKVAPIYSTFLALFCLAAAGTPGLNSFVGEFLIIRRRHSGSGRGLVRWLSGVSRWALPTCCGCSTGWSWASSVQALQGLRLDLNVREVVTLAPLVVLAVVIGLYPESVLGCPSRVGHPVAGGSGLERRNCGATVTRSGRPASRAGPCRRGPGPHRRRRVGSRAQVVAAGLAIVAAGCGRASAGLAMDGPSLGSGAR